MTISACRKKTNCMQHKCNRKKFLHCYKEEKEMLQSYFIIPVGELYKITAKQQPFSSLAPFELSIWWCCRIIASFVQYIISLLQAVMEVKIFIKNQVLIDKENYFFQFFFNFELKHFHVIIFYLNILFWQCLIFYLNIIFLRCFN